MEGLWGGEGLLLLLLLLLLRHCLKVGEVVLLVVAVVGRVDVLLRLRQEVVVGWQGGTAGWGSRLG